MHWQSRRPLDLGADSARRRNDLFRGVTKMVPGELIPGDVDREGRVLSWWRVLQESLVDSVRIDERGVTVPYRYVAVSVETANNPGRR